MTGNSRRSNENESNLERVKLIADKRQSLQDNSAQIQDQIKQCFERLTELLRIREERLLRQVEAVHVQQLSLVQSDSEILPSVPYFVVDLPEKELLEERILDFGKIELNGVDCMKIKDAKPYTVEEYQEADQDHVSFSKSIVHGSRLTDTNVASPQMESAGDKSPSCSKDEADFSDRDECDGQELKSEHSEHPKQVQQWLRHILVETEAEPAIHEPVQFSELSKVRVSVENVECTLES